jgi:hypothetical protein
MERENFCICKAQDVKLNTKMRPARKTEADRWKCGRGLLQRLVRIPTVVQPGARMRKEEHALTIENRWPPYQLTPSTQDDTCPPATNTVATVHTIHPTYLTNLKYSLSDLF